ncbi:MAG: hypothetical protein IT556_17080 [Acetobacteraceae bacterium]|nr:hypothetical protein [Acetobacteraceae bacterium]
MQHDPLDAARRRGLAPAAEKFPDAVREADEAARLMAAAFRRDLAPAAEPALILPPLADRPLP